MALVAKTSMTITAKQDPISYVVDIDTDLITLFVAMRTTPQVTKGVVAPTSTPKQIGDIFVDTVLAEVYIATGIASSADWTLLN